MNRKAGILMHPTSLPGSAGIGSLGKNAFKFIDFLEKAGMKLWQVLPLGPTGFGDSPYQSFSTFALNPLLIDFDDLLERGWALKKDIKKPSNIKVSSTSINYGDVVLWKTRALKAIAKSFLESITNPEAGSECNINPDVKAEFFAFCRENEYWLKDYAAFTSIKSYYDAKAQKECEEKQCYVCGTWNVYWDKALSKHEDAAVEKWINEHSEDYLQTEVIQFFAAKQWNALHDYAKLKGIQIVGDIPIFVASDSSDVWANQKSFLIDDNGRFTAVAGVPPDYFSATGQLWGNPLYNWNVMKNDGYSWWINRVKKMLSLVDYVRIDHFRGFESFWAVPFGSENAINGKWEKGPGIELFNAIKKELGELPLIAEDLGIITDEVRALRDEAQLPGMKVLQFAFDKNEWYQGSLKNAFLPHNYESSNCVAYTGTHDNDTSQGWLESLDEQSLILVCNYLTGEKNSAETAGKLVRSKKLTKLFIKAVLSSTAEIAVIPLQDIYCLGSTSRMNTPSTSGSNWSWRASSGMISGQKALETAEWLKAMNVLYSR